MESLTLRALRRAIEARLPTTVRDLRSGPGGTGLELVLGDGTIVLDAGGRRPVLRTLPPPAGTGRSTGRRKEFEWNGDPGYHEVAWHLGNRAVGGRLVRIAGHGLDRILALTFEQKDRFGDARRTTLVIEVFGAFVNFLVLDGGFDGTILSRLRDDNRGSAGTRLERGRRYEPPPRDRIDLELDGRAPLVERLRMDRRLDRAAVGVGPIVHQEVLARAGGDSPEAMVEAFVELIRLVDDQPAPGTSGGRALPFQPAGATDWQPTDSLAEALERVTTQAAEPRKEGGGNTARRELVAELARRRTAAMKRLDQLAGERDRHPDETTPRRWAETLLAAADRVPRGALEVKLPAVDGEGELTIPLDPGKSATENADRWFKEARKARQSTERLPREIERSRRELDRIESFESRLNQIPEADGAGAKSLAAEYFGRPGSQSGRQPTRPPHDGKARSGGRLSDIPVSLLPKRYILGGGWTALVGRSQASNDYLTHRLAEPHDLWFHAHGCAGSHVVLKGPDRKAQPGRAILETAAALAAWNSKARNAARVPVIYAEKRHVRKPRGSKPGLAAVTNEKSVMVAPGEPAGAMEEA